MKKTFLILFLLAALNACTEEAWIPSSTNNPNTHYGVKTSGENIDYENKEIMYLKVYDTDGLLVSFGYKTDSVQLPKQILRENNSYIFVPETDFKPPISLFEQDLKYVERLYGKYKIVNSFPDIKVQIVNSFPDIKIQIVNSFPDLKVKEVTAFPGF